jgi:hypothetical protein
MPAASDIDPELMIEALLMSVEDMGDAGADWLRGEFDRVRDLFVSGAKFCTSTSFRGQSTQVAKEVRTDFLLAVLTQTRRRLQEQTDGASANSGAMLIPRLTDFPF